VRLCFRGEAGVCLVPPESLGFGCGRWWGGIWSRASGTYLLFLGSCGLCVQLPTVFAEIGGCCDGLGCLCADPFGGAGNAISSRIAVRSMGAVLLLAF